MDTRGGRTTELSIVNGNDAAVEVELELRETAGRNATQRRNLAAGEQWVLDAGQTFGEEAQGALAMEADAPVSASGVLRIPDGRGNTLLAAAPRARDAGTELLGQRRVLPAVTTGAGQQIAYVLLNATDEPMAGVLEIDGGLVDYEIAPGSVFVQETLQDTRPAATGFGHRAGRSGQRPERRSTGTDRA